LIRKAIEKGARDIFLGIGGSATHDLGTGILRSLGVKFLDENDKELKTPSQLLKLKKIDHSSLDTLPDNLKITFLCDVNNKLLGKNGAAYTYAKQKGAETQYLIQKCEELSNIFYNYFNEEKNIEIGNKPGDGAAGGLPSIIRVLIHSELKSGANFTFDIAGIDQILNKVQLVITGEGSFDKQSFFGKGPGLLLDKARKLNKYSIVLCGKISPDVYIKDQQNVSFLSINNSSEEIKIAIKNTDRNLYSSAKSVLKVLKLGLKYQKQLN